MNEHTPSTQKAPSAPTTPLQVFFQKWSGGCGSELCPGRVQHAVPVTVCLCRGQVPCEVLFIGEAPGKSENVLGAPFVGPAGHLLDRIVRRAFTTGEGLGIRCAYTNVVCCIPFDPEGSDKLEKPPWDAVQSCAPRLQEFVALCRPRLVVAVGVVARDCLDVRFKGAVELPSSPRRAFIDHPARILRANPVQRPLMEQRAVVTLREAVESL